MNYLNRNLNFTSILAILLFAVIHAANAQDEVINATKVAIKSGNHKELSKNFNDMIDLGFDGDKGSFSKTQAEFVLKDFFLKNPPTDFEYVHKGASKEGLTYTIGNYHSKTNTYRVLVYIKEIKGLYKIDYLDFSKE